MQITMNGKQLSELYEALQPSHELMYDEKKLYQIIVLYEAKS